jgi:hypothetical protein
MGGAASPRVQLLASSTAMHNFFHRQSQHRRRDGPRAGCGAKLLWQKMIWRNSKKDAGSSERSAGQRARSPEPLAGAGQCHTGCPPLMALPPPVAMAKSHWCPECATKFRAGGVDDGGADIGHEETSGRQARTPGRGSEADLNPPRGRSPPSLPVSAIRPPFRVGRREIADHG